MELVVDSGPFEVRISILYSRFRVRLIWNRVLMDLWEFRDFVLAGIWWKMPAAKAGPFEGCGTTQAVL